MVPLALLAVLLGLAAGSFTRGRLGAIGVQRLRGASFAFGALALAVWASVIDLGDVLSIVALAGSYLLAGGFLVANRRTANGVARAGLLLLAAGWLLNSTVIGLNGGMPLSLHAYGRSGQTAPVVAGEGGFARIIVADERTDLAWLGDVIPLRPMRQVISPGDVLLLGGLTLFVAGAMHTRRAPADFPRAREPR